MAESSQQVNFGSQVLGSQVKDSQVNNAQLYQSNRAQDVAALIESSKNLLYDLKLLEERNDSQAERYLGGGDAADGHFK